MLFLIRIGIILFIFINKVGDMFFVFIYFVDLCWGFYCIFFIDVFEYFFLFCEVECVIFKFWLDILKWEILKIKWWCGCLMGCFIRRLFYLDFFFLVIVMCMYIFVLRLFEIFCYIILFWFIRIVFFWEYLFCEIIDL